MNIEFIKELQSLFTISNEELLLNLKEYGASDINDISYNDTIYTLFDAFIDNCLSQALSENNINDTQRDILIDTFMKNISIYQGGGIKLVSC